MALIVEGWHHCHLAPMVITYCAYIGISAQR